MKKAGIDDTPANTFEFLLDRVKGNLHLVLGMSPVGEAFRSVDFLEHVDFISGNLFTGFALSWLYIFIIHQILIKMVTF